MPPSSSGGSIVSTTPSGMDSVNSTDFGASGTPTAARMHVLINQLIHYSLSIGSSSWSKPLLERSHLHDLAPESSVFCRVLSHPGPNVLLWGVPLNGVQPCLSRTTTQSSPFLRRVIDPAFRAHTWPSSGSEQVMWLNSFNRLVLIV